MGGWRASERAMDGDYLTGPHSASAKLHAGRHIVCVSSTQQLSSDATDGGASSLFLSAVRKPAHGHNERELHYHLYKLFKCGRDHARRFCFGPAEKQFQAGWRLKSVKMPCSDLKIFHSENAVLMVNRLLFAAELS